MVRMNPGVLDGGVNTTIRSEDDHHHKLKGNGY